MAADYYVSLKSGSVVKITGVTASPTIVSNDGVASTVSSGTYRNLISGFGTSTYSGTTTEVPLWGPGFTMMPFYTYTAADGLKFRATAGAVGPFELFKDDRIMGVAPRALTWTESHWKFNTAGGNYFIPFKEVLAMSNSEPLY